MFSKVYNKKQTHAQTVYKLTRNSLNRTIKTAKYNHYILIKTIKKNNGRILDLQ